MSTASKPRDLILDLLRGAALFGVFVVNIQSYATGFAATSLGLIEPTDGALALVLHFLIAAFLEYKSYPILAFLLGYGLCMQHHRWRLQGTSAKAMLCRRAVVLLLLGVLHGLTLYYGDVLSRYAVAMLVVIAILGVPMSARRILMFVKISVLFLVVTGVTASIYAIQNPGALDTPVIASAALIYQGAIANGPWRSIASQSALSYVEVFFSIIPSLPLFIATLGYGYACGRWRVLERLHAAPSIALARRWRNLALSIGLPLALACAASSVASVWVKGSNWAWPSATLAILSVSLSLGYIYLATRYCSRLTSTSWLVRALAAMGQRSLTNYLSQSVIMALILGYAGLRLGDDLRMPGLTLVAVIAFGCQLVLNLWMQQKGIEGPAERVMRYLMNRTAVRYRSSDA